MESIMQQRINNAIVSLCVDIENEFSDKTYVDLKEEDILFEFSSNNLCAITSASIVRNP